MERIGQRHYFRHTGRYDKKIKRIFFNRKNSRHTSLYAVVIMFIIYPR